ncbi:MAG: hypothetical protein C4294_20190 [Nitrospiraceae bacterium]
MPGLWESALSAEKWKLFWGETGNPAVLVQQTRKYLLDSFAESGLLNDAPAVEFVRCDQDDLFAAHDPWLGIGQ